MYYLFFKVVCKLQYVHAFHDVIYFPQHLGILFACSAIECIECLNFCHSYLFD